MKNTYTLKVMHPANPHNMNLTYVDADTVRTSENSFLFFAQSNSGGMSELICAYPTQYTIIEKVTKNTAK